MKNIMKITFCGLMAALCTAFMLLSYFPYFTYAVPGIAGLAMLVVLIEINAKWALGTYAVAAGLSLIFAEPESKLMFIFFLGYYPILKAFIERIKIRAVQYAVKFTVFNAAVFFVYFLLANLFAINLGEMGALGKYGLIGLILLANFTFWLYDIVLYRASCFYIQKLHRPISRLLKK